MKKMDLMAMALESGFMLSTAHGQGADKLMPVTDTDTLQRLAEKIEEAAAPGAPCCGDYAACDRACVQRGRWIEREQSKSGGDLESERDAFEEVLRGMGFPAVEQVRLMTAIGARQVGENWRAVSVHDSGNSVLREVVEDAWKGISDIATDAQIMSARKIAEQLREIAKELRNALSGVHERSSSVPEGWKLVPMEATGDMIAAAMGSHPQDWNLQARMQENVKATWRSMLAAVPTTECPTRRDSVSCGDVRNRAAAVEHWRAQNEPHSGGTPEPVCVHCGKPRDEHSAGSRPYCLMAGHVTTGLAFEPHRGGHSDA